MQLPYQPDRRWPIARSWVECDPAVDRSTSCRCTPRLQVRPKRLPRPRRCRGANRWQYLCAFESPLRGAWWDRIGRGARDWCAVIDDVGRDENQEVALLVVGTCFTEESADDRQIDEQWNA